MGVVWVCHRGAPCPARDFRRLFSRVNPIPMKAVSGTAAATVHAMLGNPDAAATSKTPGATWNTLVVLPLAPQRSAQAIRSARSLIPRSVLWLITKLTASTGSTRNRAHVRV